MKGNTVTDSTVFGIIRDRIGRHEGKTHIWLCSLQGIAKDIFPSLLDAPEIRREDAIRRGIAAAHFVAARIAAEAPYDQVDPGHGLGHHLRDYTHALLLANASGPEMDPRIVAPAIVGAVAHDMGCFFFRRYDDARSSVKHAGAGALLLHEIFGYDDCGLTQIEQHAALYAVAAHTHYLNPQTTTDADGVERTLPPYPDTDPNGNPYVPVWFTRWVDRLDCNGPTFVGRHYLTLVSAHPEYLDGKFSESSFAHAMQPLLRTREERGGDAPTMLEHLHTFAASQTNASPYGRFDSDAMQQLRDRQTARLQRIVNAVRNPQPIRSHEERTSIATRWEQFLATVIEPHPKTGAPAARALTERFATLPQMAQDAWFRGFEATMAEYQDYLDQILPMLADLRNQPDGEHVMQFLNHDLISALTGK